MDAGELVPDEIVVGVVEECLAPGGPLGDGFVLDGFPRTLHQARELDRVLGGRPLDLADRPRRAPRDRARPHRGPARVRELPAGVPREHAADERLDVRHVRRRRRAARRRHRGGGRAPARALRAARRCRSSTTTASVGCSQVVDGVGEGDDVFERLVKVVDDHLTLATGSSDDGPAQDARPDRRTCAGPGAVVAEMHEACTRAAKPGATTADLDARRARRARPPARPLELPRLPRVPGRGLHLAQRGDRARHPRRPACSKTATSSRSTAARSSRAGTPTPRSRSRSATIDDESQRLIDVTRAVARRRDRGGRRRATGSATSAPRSRAWSPRPGSRSCGSTSATASAPRCTRSPTSRTTGRRAGACGCGRAWCSRSSRW